MKIAFVIPARYNSKRLPGKPLKKILGVPMLLRTVKQCLKLVKRKDLFVATDHIKISELCKKNNINVVIVKKKCLTGTDRVAQFSKIKKNYTHYINIQGDEPIFNPLDLKKMIKFIKKNPKYVYGGYCNITNKLDFNNNSIPKIVLNNKSDLLYTSRAGIPANKNNKFIKGFRQVCIYSFPKKMLKIFNSISKKSFLENIEDLELLRFVENNINVKMIKMSDKSVSVDLPEDIKKVERILKK